jgi:serine/threonine-protein phosphatase 2B catalytic subunit
MESNLVHLNDPVSIIGDIHGQYYDLIKILKLQKWDTYKQSYLFLGDYVDRGMFSIQTILLVLALKINAPKRVIMLRGNHECRQLTTHFNFRSQCTNLK